VLVKILFGIVKGIDWLNEKIGYLTSWLTTLMVLVVCYDVFTRYFLRASSVAVQELEWHIFSVIFLIGAAYTLKVEGHVRVDVFYSHMRPRSKAIIDLFGCIVFLIPFSLLVIWTSKDFVSMSYAVQEISPDPGGLHYRYLLKAMIPAGFVLVLLQGIALMIRSFLTVIGRPLENGDGKEENHA
jgi:TRAP-type mannitol/chloroaromatic compound transport system permease small subunit